MSTFEPQQLKNRVFDTTLGLWRLCDRFPKEDQPLVFRLRERAAEVLDDTVTYFAVRGRSIALANEVLSSLLMKVEVLRTLLDLARMRQHIQEMNFLLLDWEYEQLLQLLQEDIRAIETHGAVMVSSSAQQQTPFSASFGKGRESVPGSSAGLTVDSAEGTVFSAQASRAQEQKQANMEFLDSLSERQKLLYEYFLRNKRATMQELTANFSDVTDRTLRMDLTQLISSGLLKRSGTHPRFVYLLGTQTPASMQFIHQSSRPMSSL